MNARQNHPDEFEAIRSSLQARAILDVLLEEGCSNTRLLATWLERIGLTASSRTLGDLLDQLEKHGLVSIEHVEEVRVVRLRRFGGEVARGLETLEWIAGPELSA
jgi:DNA-binding PadR family transcriptional regulator